MRADSESPAAVVVPVSAPNAYGTIRSLAARGVRVLALDQESVPLRRSRLCRFRPAPDPDLEPRHFVAFLRDLAASLPAPPVVFATQDIHATVIQRHADALRDFIRYPFLPFERFRACVDKRLMLRRAEELGLPVPETHAPGDPDALERLLPRLARYPYVLKPAAKFEWNGDDPRDNFRFHRAYRTKALRARSPDELRRRSPPSRGRATPCWSRRRSRVPPTGSAPWISTPTPRAGSSPITPAASSASFPPTSAPAPWAVRAGWSGSWSGRASWWRGSGFGGWETSSSRSGGAGTT